jgi:cytochrome c
VTIQVRVRCVRCRVPAEQGQECKQGDQMNVSFSLFPASAGVSSFGCGGMLRLGLLQNPVAEL